LRCAAILLLLALLPVGCNGEKPLKDAKWAEEVRLTMGGVEVLLETALTDPERTKGLMYREQLAPNGGMLFVYPRVKTLSFWMSNTWIPLSIAFLREDGTVINIEEMEPLREIVSYRSEEPCRFAIEMNRGWFATRGIKKGDRIALTSEIYGLEAR